MTPPPESPERWRVVKAALQAALERPAAERGDVLDRMCGADAALRREVESLLASAEVADSFLGVPAAGRGCGNTQAAAGLMDRLTTALAGRYVPERELGRGGMATVFLARDVRHSRPVALKVLAPELAAVLGPERFLSEIGVTANLQHPHLLPLFDSGEADRLLYYTMPYVEGESLRARLAVERQLPIEAAVRMTVAIAGALDYAHRRGVIHRDLKPENILLVDGQPMVADFGIALAVAKAGGARVTETGISLGTPHYMSPEQSTGDKHLDGRSDIYSLGCVLYEMLTGEPPFTGPTVQAVIAKRLTTPAPSARITRPDITPTLDSVLRRALATAPADRYATAANLAQALAAALTAPAGPPSPTVRQAAYRGSFRAGLVLLGMGLLVGSGALFTWSRARRAQPPPRVEPAAAVTRVAVLPFENLGTPEDGYLVEGLSDEIRGRLSAVPGMQVIARASSNDYRRSTKPLGAIAGELGVRYVLTGTVRAEPSRAGRPARVRITPELVEIVAGSAPVNRWTQAFDSDTSDVFAMQADISARVAAAMNVALGKDDRARLIEAPTRSAAAFDAYLRGEAIADGLNTPDLGTVRRALAYYRQAVALDSGFAEAWAKRSMAAANLYYLGASGQALRAESREAADRAIALAPDYSRGYLALGTYYTWVEFDHARALSTLTAGLRLSPNNPELLSAVASAEVSRGQNTDAVRHFRAAAGLDPRSGGTMPKLAFALIFARDYPAARVAADRAVTLWPGNVFGLAMRAMVELAQGDLVGARHVIDARPAELDSITLITSLALFQDLGWVLDDAKQRRLLSLPPSAFDNDRGNWGWALAQVHAFRGDSARARAYADSARASFEARVRENPDDALIRVNHALTLATVGRKSDAVREGERAVALLPLSRDAFLGAYVQHQLVRVYMLIGQLERALDTLEPLLRMPYYLSPGWLRIDPIFAPLRGNPRFERLAAGG